MARRSRVSSIPRASRHPRRSVSRAACWTRARSICAKASWASATPDSTASARRLRPLPAEGALAVHLVVADDQVREAFVRVAYYASATGRSRQIAVVDSQAVVPGEGRLLFVTLDPPVGAVAYRVRVLARLRAGSERSQDEAIRARVGLIDRAATRFGSQFSRLLPDGP